MHRPKILLELIEEWGDRDTYLIESDQIGQFLSAGATLQEKKDNKDGTFSIALVLCGKHLVAVTTE